MSYILNRSATLDGPVIDALRADGISDADILTAIQLQARQRESDAPILTLREICGLDQPTRRSHRSGPCASALNAIPRRRPGRGGLHITRASVWAGSVQTGSDAEAEFIEPIDKHRRSRLMSAIYGAARKGFEFATAARAGQRTLSENDKKLIRITPRSILIFRWLLKEAVSRKGFVTPDYDTIASEVAVSRSTVWRSINLLADLGIIEWIRRFDYERDKEKGARSTQTSNLYRFALPTWLAKLLGMDPPPPADAVSRRDDALEDHAAMLASTSPAERRRLMPQDAASRTALSLAAHRRDQRLRREDRSRELQGETAPPLLILYSKGRDDESASTADAISPDGLCLA